MDGLGAESEEKREPASDIEAAVVDSLKVLDPERPIREADMTDLAGPRNPVLNPVMESHRCTCTAFLGSKAGERLAARSEIARTTDPRGRCDGDVSAPAPQASPRPWRNRPDRPGRRSKAGLFGPPQQNLGLSARPLKGGPDAARYHAIPHAPGPLGAMEDPSPLSLSESRPG
jgi:hypothetical protein